MKNLQQLRLAAARSLILFLWGHVLLVLIVALIMEQPVVVPTIGAFALALGATLAEMGEPGALAGRLAISVSAMGVVGLLVYLFTGHHWQIDIHMYFFAVLAILTIFVDWRTILAATVTVALHHLVLNFVFPAAVFPDGEEFARVVLHAVVVLAEAGALIWLAHQIASTFKKNEMVLETAQAAQARAEQISADQVQTQKTLETEHEQAVVKLRLVDGLEGSVGTVIDEISGAAGHLNDQAGALSRLSIDTVESTSAAAKRIGETRQNVEEVVRLADSMTASIDAIRSEIERSTAITRAAVAEAQNTDSTVSGLAEAAQKISSVIELIDNIAAQTNLLALNATIEAARAGDAGKGFAVVASEVKTLANQTAQATEEISGQINAIQSGADQSVQAIRKIGETVDQIDQISGGITEAVGTQAKETSEIVVHLREVSSRTTTASEEMNRVETHMGEARSVTDGVAQAAQTFSQQTRTLSNAMGDFLKRMRQSS